MKIIFAAHLCKYSLTFPVHVIFPCSHIHPKWCSLSCITQPFPYFLLLATILYENTDRQGGITCEAIDEPRKSLKAIDKHVIINFCDKNVVIARLRDKNEVFILFIYIRGVRSDAQLSCTETRFQKCSQSGKNIFLHILFIFIHIF